MLLTGEMQFEVIFGDVVAKSNNYLAVPGGGGGRRIIKSEKVREYEKKFCDQAVIYKDARIDVPFIFEVDVYFKSKCKDLDNAIKTLLDCLQYIHAITDDNLCVEIRARKHVCRAKPHVKYRIIPIQQKMFG